MLKLIKISIILLIILAVQGLTAQITWEPTGGPYGGSIRKIKIGPDGTLFAFSYGSAYQSTNNGQAWSWMNFGNFNPNDVFFKNDGTIFATSEFDNSNNNELYRSSDMTNWEKKSVGLENRAIHNIVFHSSAVIACTDSGLYQSTDNGDNWNKISSIPGVNHILLLGFNSKGAMFAGTYAGLYRSLDSGKTWQLIGDGTDQTRTNIENLVIDSSDSIFMTTPYGIYRSYDGGDNWEHLTNGIVESNMGFLELLGNNKIFAGTSWSGCYLSMDYGNTWTQIINIGGSDFVMIGNKNVFVATNGGILFADSLSGTWSYKNNGINELQTSAILINKSNSQHKGEIFTGDVNGNIYKSTDNGNSWIVVNRIQGVGVSSIIFGGEDTLYASTIWGGVYRSVDDGESWEVENSGLDDPDVRAIAIDHNGILYAGTFSKIFKSTDKGETWVTSLSQSQSVQCSTLVVNKKNWLFAGTIVYGALRSKDGGLTWQQISTGMQVPIQFMAINDNDELFAATLDGNLYHSTNDGENWTLLKSGMGIFNLFVVNNNDLLAAVDVNHQDIGVYRSVDDGQTWFPEKNGLNNKYAFAFDINSDGYVFVCTNTGVYRSTSTILGVTNSTETASLLNIYPNPAESQTTINYSISKDGLAQIDLYDMLGNKVKTIFDGFVVSGNYSYTLNTEVLLPGSYYLRFSSSGKNIIQLLLKVR